jgi:uncharacterized protein
MKISDNAFSAQSLNITYPDNAPVAFHLLAKPCGPACNLDCAYCFFLDKAQFYPGSNFRMSENVLEQYIKQLIEAHQVDEVSIAWQGGEPTLMGLDFYHRAMEIVEKYRRPGMSFLHTMQTNATLLDEAWCTLFKKYNFLIGVSIDGPQELHDIYRLDRGGNPTFNRVVRGIRLLQKHGVDFNILVTVNRVNADYPLDVYRFIRDEIGADWIQFIPVVERINADGLALYQQGNQVSERSVKPEQYGQFLCTIFDEWVHKDVGRVFVQTFEAALANWAGMGSSGICVFNPTCGSALAMEHNGDLYACDHFVEPDYFLGNINNSHMLELVSSEQQLKFGRDKRESLPQFCLDCDVRFACHGECPKNRFLKTPEGEPGLNYLCDGLKTFFHHIDQPAKIIIGLLGMGRPADAVMQILASEETRLAGEVAKAGRNSQCPCGSGLKVKHCHGRAPQNEKTSRPLPEPESRSRKKMEYSGINTKEV